MPRKSERRLRGATSSERRVVIGIATLDVVWAVFVVVSHGGAQNVAFAGLPAFAVLSLIVGFAVRRRRANDGSARRSDA